MPFSAQSAGLATKTAAPARVFAATGIVREVKPDAMTVVTRHEDISNYMAAMTLLFKV